MAKGFVGGFVKRNGKWYGHWVLMDEKTRRPRQQILKDAKELLVQHFANYCRGEAVARRQMIVIDALTRDGRECLEKIFAAMKSDDSTEDQSDPQTQES